MSWRERRLQEDLLKRLKRRMGVKSHVVWRWLHFQVKRSPSWLSRRQDNQGEEGESNERVCKWIKVPQVNHKARGKHEREQQEATTDTLWFRSRSLVKPYPHVFASCLWVCVSQRILNFILGSHSRKRRRTPDSERLGWRQRFSWRQESKMLCKKRMRKVLNAGDS